MAQNYKAGLIITGDASGGIRAIKATEDELGKLNQGFARGSRDSRRFGSDAERAGQQVREIGHGSTDASKGLTLVRQAATLAMAAFSIRQIGAYADGWSELNSRVLNTTKDIDVSEQTMSRLAQTARDTYSGLNLTAEAYLNNATTLTELGYSTERQLDLSDALNNSLVISATRGQKASSVMDALSKSFADGQLRGDNFNTVIQSGGRIAEALAAGLGVTTIELRKMASEGELTTSRVFEALTSQMEVLREEAAAMPATIEDGFTLIGNSAMELVGRVDKAFGTSEGIAGIMIDAADAMSASIDPLIDNMDTIQDVAILTATVVAGRYAAAFAESSKKVATNTVETVANTRANVAATTAARAKAAEVLRVAQAEQAAASRALANGHAIAAATGNTTLRSKAITQMAAANQRAIAAEAAHTAAVNANAVAMQRSTVTAYAMAAASRAASGALALVGGPVGAAILAGTAAYYFRDSLGFTSAAAREAKQDIDQLVESLENYTHAQYQNNRVSIVQDLAEARVEAEKLQRQIDELQEQSQQQGMWYQGHSGSATDKIAELMPALREQNRIVAANEEGLKKYDQAWKDVLESQVTGVSIFRTLDQWLMTNGDTVSETSRRFNALGDTLGEGGEKWDDYIAKLQAARDVMGMTAAESAQYAAVQQGFTGLYADQAAAVAGQTDALSDYRKAIADGNSTEAEAHLARAQRYAEAEAMVTAQLANIGTLTNLLQGVQTELSATALSAALVVGDSAGAMAANVSTAIQAINDRAAAIRQTTTVTVKNTAANREATKAAREAEQAAEAQASALRSLQEEMDPLLRDHATYIDRVNVLEKALAAGTITQEAFAEAVRWSADQYTRAASGAEDYEKQTESLVGKYDSLNQRAKLLRNELDLINQRYRAGIYDADQYGRMVANVRDEMDQLAKESENSGDRISQSFTTWGTIADNTLRSLDDAGRDTWLGLIDGSTSALDTVERAFQQTLANIAHMLTTQQLTFHAAGFLGLDTSGMPGGQQAGGMQSMFNNMNPGMLQKGWETASGWFSGGSSAPSLGVQGGVSNTAIQSANQVAAGSSSGWAGGSMQNYQGMGAVYNMGASMAGGYVGGEVGSSVTGKTANSNYGETAGSLVGSYWGPWGAAAGSAIGSFVDSLFGSNKKTYDFDFQQGGHHGVFGDRSSELGDFGLTALSDYKLGEQQDALQELLTSVADFDNVLAGAAIDERVDAMRASIEGFRHSGPEDLFDTRLREIINGSGAYVESAIAAIADPEQMADAFVSVLNLERIATSLNDQIQRDVIDHLEANTGDITGTVGSLGQAIDATLLLGNSVERLNLQFDTTATGAIHSAWALQEAAGGVENMAAINSAYYQAAFSETERLSNAQQDLFASLSSVTDQTPHTVEELRALVEAQNLNSAAGGELAYELMALAPALKETSTAVRQALEEQYQEMLGRAPEAAGIDYWFEQVASGSTTLTDALGYIASSAEAAAFAAGDVADAIDNVADTSKDAAAILRERDQLERQLLQLQGNTIALRERDLASIDPSNRAMQEHIWAMQDQATAAQEAEQAAQSLAQAEAQVANERMGLERQILQAMGDTNALRQMDLAQLDPSNRALQQRVWAIQDEQQATADAEAEINRVRQALDSTGNASRGASDALSALRSELNTAQNAAQSAWDNYRKQSLDIEIGLLELVGDQTAIVALQRERELEGIDESLRPMQERLWAMQDEVTAQQAATQAAQNYSSELARVRGELANTLGSISNWIDQRNATSGAPSMNLSEAGDQFARQLILAQAGDRDALQSITQYADQYLTAGEAMYASGGAFQRIQQDVLDALQDLPDQISAEQFLADEIKEALREQTQGISTELGGVLRGDNPSNIAGNLAGYFTTLAGGIDGVLTREQLAIVMSGKATDAELAAIMRAVDLNGDGVMSGLESVIIAGMPTDAVLGTVLRNKMNELDKNQLTHAQVRTALSPIASDAEIKALIKRVDVNGDGIISKQELANGRLSGLAQGIGSTLKPMFDGIDIDGSGWIDYGEFAKAFAGMASDAELKRIFDKLDKDGTGQISRLEAIEAYTAQTDDNTQPIEDRARDQIAALGTLDTSMHELAEGMISMSSGVAGLINAIAQLADIQAEEIKMAGAEAALSQSTSSMVSGIRNTASQAATRWDEMTPDDRMEYGGLNNYLTSSRGGLSAGWGAIKYAGSKSVNNWNRLLSTIDVDEDWLQENPDFVKGESFNGDQQYVYVPQHRAIISEWERLTGARFGGNRYAMGGVFSGGDEVGLGRPGANSIVGRSTMFNIGEMGEADPEAIVPLSRGAGGRLGMDATGLMRLPDGPLELPMPDIPLPQFPALGNNDVLQVLQDVKRELQESHKETKRLQEENNRHVAASVAVQQAGFNGQISEAKKTSRALADIASDVRLEGTR